VLRGLAADQRAPREHAAFRDPLHDGRDPLGHHLPAGDVVGHEQRLGAAHHEVVDNHADEVVADGVVAVHGRRDGDLGADTVGGGGEKRPAVRGQCAGVEESREAPDATHDLGSGGLGHPGLHQLDRTVTGLDAHARGLVAHHVSLASVAVRVERCGAASSVAVTSAYRAP
jgi:hypothetical protein